MMELFLQLSCKMTNMLHSNAKEHFHMVVIDENAVNSLAVEVQTRGVLYFSSCKSLSQFLDWLLL